LGRLFPTFEHECTIVQRLDVSVNDLWWGSMFIGRKRERGREVRNVWSKKRENEGRPVGKKDPGHFRGALLACLPRWYNKNLVQGTRSIDTALEGRTFSVLVARELGEG